MLKVAWSPLYCHPLPEGHRFPMIKYDLIREQLLYEGLLSEENFYEPPPIDEETILLTHCAGYWQKLVDQKLTKKEQRRTGFPLSPRLVQRGRIIAHGTLIGARLARKYGVSLNVAGGTHHAFRNRGEGFCLINDIAIAARAMLESGEITRALIIDLDVHQGNGTAAIFEDEPAVFTFSMHCEANYPLHKMHSDRDIGLPVGTEDREYLSVLKENLEELFQLSNPDLVFYLSGVDVLATDKLGKLALTQTGCRTRDQMVFEACKKNETPVTVSLGGGYSSRLRDIVEAHCHTFRVAKESFF